MSAGATLQTTSVTVALSPNAAMTAGMAIPTMAQQIPTWRAA